MEYRKGRKGGPKDHLTSLDPFSGMETAGHPFPTVKYSVSDPAPGSGAFLTPGSGIRNRFFPDPGPQIPDPKTIFLRAF